VRVRRLKKTVQMVRVDLSIGKFLLFFAYIILLFCLVFVCFNLF
jgi:hypothetical protein